MSQVTQAPTADAPLPQMNVRATPRVRGFQVTALTILVVSGVVNYIDRATLAIANPLIRQDLGMSLGEMGLLLSAFLWAYAFSQLPAGALIDKLGPRRLLSIGLTIWSLAQFAGGLVTSMPAFFVARAGLGVGEAPQFPTGARVVRDWFNVRQRGGATGVFNCASTLGTAIAAPLLTWLMLSFGWRWMFMIMGIAGLIVALVWFILYRDPKDAGLTPAEHRMLTEGDVTGATTTVTFDEWRRLLGCRTTWGMILGFFGTVYITWIFNSWLPVFFEMTRHMSIKMTGYAAAIPAVAGVIGALFGGVLVDWLVRAGLSPINSRKYPMTISLLGMAFFTIAAAYVPTTAEAIGCVSAAMFLGYVSSSTAWAMASVAAPASCTASIGAMQNFGGYLGGALAPMVTGFIVQATGSFTPALAVGAGIGVVSAICYFVIIQGPVTATDLEPRGIKA